ncbi:MAG TPA: SGNH/GDSL hydrolase family protein [Thermoanaerobaculia bacterium]|nr:SGNH/GDSL hydrolase family protein [Thermoanaerobaculia bacterium]
MADLSLRIASALSFTLLPIVLLQGWRARRAIPRLPEAQGPREGEIPGAGPALRLLVLGESTAAGVGAANHMEGLTGQTAQALAAATGRSVLWSTLGRNGLTAQAARVELLEPAAELRADIAVLAFGVNDTLRLHSRRRWVTDLTLLVAALRKRCGAIPVILTAVPPMGSFPALPRPLRDLLGLRARLLDRTAQRWAAQQEAVHHVAIPSMFGDAVAIFFCEDRFHPSPLGYQRWGHALGHAVAQLCEDQSARSATIGSTCVARLPGR